MTPARRDGRFLLALGATMFLALSVFTPHNAPLSGWDFKLVYNASRCLLRHADPYRESEYMHIYLAEGGVLPDAAHMPPFSESMRYPYLPTAFVTFPFAALPLGLAHALWLTLTASSFLLAAFLMEDLAAEFAPRLAGALTGFLLAGSGLLLVHCNVAGVAVALCVIAVWCFVRQRLAVVGVLCLALSLMLKPNDTALVWTYLLLARGIYRRRALQTLLVAAVLSLPLLVWIAHVAPEWPRELAANLASITSHGHANDPGPASMSVHGIGMIVSLQSVLSLLRDDPAFYNPVSYVVCGVLFFLWSLSTHRSRPTPRQTWLALASVAALSMLPFYHRLYDTRLLMLIVPACAILWSEGGRLGRFALAITAATLLLTADLSWLFLTNFLNRLPQDSHSGILLTAIQVLPVPLLLLLTAAFYPYACLRPTPQAQSF